MDRSECLPAQKTRVPDDPHEPAQKATIIHNGNASHSTGVVSDAPALTAFATRTFTEAFGADNRPEDLQAHLASSYNVPRQTMELTDPNIATLLAPMAKRCSPTRKFDAKIHRPALPRRSRSNCTVSMSTTGSTDKVWRNG